MESGSGGMVAPVASARWQVGKEFIRGWERSFTMLVALQIQCLWKEVSVMRKQTLMIFSAGLTIRCMSAASTGLPFG